MQHSVTVKKVYLIHGWGANRYVFDDFSQYFPKHWQVHCLDLTGHGEADFAGVFGINQEVERLASQIDDGSYVFGWSLGGLLALLMAARFPHKVKALCVMASFAKLQATPDYPEGLSQIALQKMIPLFEQDYAKYMQQFLQLQMMYAKDRQHIIADILPKMVQAGSPKALQAALNAAVDADARAELANIQVPTLLIYGAKDMITPPCMGEFISKHLPFAQFHLLPQAAHAPFLSHAKECVDLWLDFVER